MSPRSPAALLAPLLLAVAALFALVGPAHPAEFTDAAGRRVLLPDRFDRILPAERNAEVLLFVLVPEKLAGLERVPARGGLLPHAGRLPLIGWRPRSNPATLAATAQQVGADLIIDAGTVTPGRAAFADAVQQLAGVPYILIDDSYARMPRMLRAIGAVLGVRDRGRDLGTYAEHAIAGLRGRLLIRPPGMRPHVYYGLGPDGLITPLPGSPAGAAIDEGGAINVAAGLGRGGEVRIPPEQLLEWDPEIIIAERRSFYDALRRDRFWRRLSAVRSKRVYLEPTNPFGWIEDPSGINRLIGLYWLSSLFYPGATQEDLRTTVCDFYDKFYRIKLTNRRIESLVAPAGAPQTAPRYPSEPLVGLGAAPPSTLPAGTPGVKGAPTPSPGPSGVPPVQLPPMPEIASGMAPNAVCAVPAGPTPQPLPGIMTIPGTEPAAPTAAVPGQRRRPVPELPEPNLAPLPR